MRKTLLWFFHEVMTLGRMHEWRLALPACKGGKKYAAKFTCACGAERPLEPGGRWPGWRRG